MTNTADKINTRVLITGIAGFVGSHLAEYLLANTGWHLTGLMRWNEPLDNLADLMPVINSGGRVRLMEGDLTDAMSLDRVVEEARPDYVFHLAAQSYVVASFSTMASTVNTNTIGTLNLLEVIRRRAPNAWVHVCSSSEVYGNVPEELLPIDESCPFFPTSPYSISKVGADLMSQYYASAYGMRVLVTRMFTHTGPRRGDVFAESSFAKQVAMIEAGMTKPVVWVGDLKSKRTIADVRDAVRAYHMLLTVNPVPGGVYNIGGDHTCSVGHVLKTLLDMSEVGDCKVQTDADRIRPLDINYQLPDYSKFSEHTGWKPEIPFEKTMHDLLDYWRDRVRWVTPLQR